MKYINILAGAFGLMALAACTNNDEVTMEQPKGLQTITVAYGHGADTRLTEEWVDWDTGYKGSWDSNDQIALIKDGTKYIYQTQEGGDVATFTLVSGNAPTAEGNYMVVYPPKWDGSLDFFATQDLTNFWNPINETTNRFNLNLYKYALGNVTLEGDAFGETVTIKPVFSFLYLPEDLEIENMEYWELENSVVWDDEQSEIDEDSGEINGYGTFTSLSLKGTNLFNEIKNFKGVQGIISLNNLTVNKYNSTWSNAYDRLIPIPILPGQEPVTNLEILFGEVPCKIVNRSDGNPAEFSEGGHIYKLIEGNLKFDKIVAEVGMLIGSDGKYYAKASDMPAGVTAEAMVADVFDEGEHGNAIALMDVSNDLLTWEEAIEKVKGWANNHPINGSTDGWQLPNYFMWQNLLIGCGSTNEWNGVYEEMDFSYGNFRTNLTEAGGTDVKNGVYWGAVQSGTNLWGYDFANSKFSKFALSDNPKAYVRAVYGF